MSPWLILGAVLLVGGLTGAAYRQGREDGEAKIQSQQTREETIARAAADSAASAAAAAISAIKVQHRTITQEVQRDVLEKTVYRDLDCRHDADSLRRINAALTGASQPESASGGVLPRADAAH